MAIFSILSVLTLQYSLRYSDAVDVCGLVLTAQMNRYCDAFIGGDSRRVSQISRVGKAGPNGPPGYVNYTKINEIIKKTFKRKCDIKHVDCTQFYTRSSALSSTPKGGVFQICSRNNGRKMMVNCDLTTDGGGWMLFQQRIDGTVNFTRGWADYVLGFGEPDREYWMGLEKMHRLTSAGEFELRIDVEDWEGNKAYAQYSNFSIGPASSKYQLNVGEYSGTAGDSLEYHNTYKFSTFDEDNEDSTGNCARHWNGTGWWFAKCHVSNLNGLYISGGSVRKSWEGIIWKHWRGSDYSLKSSEMKFRPKL